MTPVAISPTDLVTLHDIAKRAGVSLLTVRQWTRRYSDTIPAPWREGRNGEPHLYLWSDWEAWLRATGRLP